MSKKRSIWDSRDLDKIKGSKNSSRYSFCATSSDIWLHAVETYSQVGTFLKHRNTSVLNALHAADACFGKGVLSDNRVSIKSTQG